MAVGNGTITRASKESTRSALDFYPTPAVAVHTLLDEEPFVGDVWECASGRGDISLVLQERGLPTVLRYSRGGLDFRRKERRLSPDKPGCI